MVEEEAGGGGGETTHYKNPEYTEDAYMEVFARVPAEYKTTTYEYEGEVSDLFEPVTYENILNGAGDKKAKQITNGAITKDNLAMRSLFGFLADRDMGAGSNALLSIPKDDLGKSFMDTFDRNHDGSVSHDEYMQMNDQWQKDREANPDSYGAQQVQYSPEKLEAVFNSMDAGNDASSKSPRDNKITLENAQNFFNSVVSSETATYTRKQKVNDGPEVEVTTGGLTEIVLENLPKKIQDATKKGSDPRTTREIIEEKKLVNPEYGRFIARSQSFITKYKRDKNEKIVPTSIRYNEIFAKMNIVHSEYRKKVGGDAEVEMPIEQFLQEMEKLGVSRDKTMERLRKDNGAIANWEKAQPNVTFGITLPYSDLNSTRLRAFAAEVNENGIEVPGDISFLLPKPEKQDEIMQTVTTP